MAPNTQQTTRWRGLWGGGVDVNVGLMRRSETGEQVNRVRVGVMADGGKHRGG